jgi:hypothetical protein
MRITRPLLVGVLCVSSYAAAQVRACLPEPHTLPDDLRSTLEARLAADAQAEEHWNDVEELLGIKDVVSKSSYRRCLISRMQERRMASFDLLAPNLYTCTTKMELPPGTVDRVTAEQLSWYVRGTARFQTSSETWQEVTQMRAYRDQGQWYFIPPQRAMQDKWEKTHYTEADFARDRRDEIDIRNSPSSPVEITDLHAYMIRKFPSLRNIKFTLRNKTSKKVVAIRVRIGIEGLEGFTEMDGPYQIKPNGSLTLEQDDSAYGDFCEGVWKREISSSERSNLLMAQNGSSRNLRLAKREANAERVVVDKSR